MVGRFMAGSNFNIFARSFFATFIFRPTFPCASIAPLNRSVMFPILSLFQESCQDFLFAIKTVVDRHMVSIIFRLFASSERPVSVSSTIASTPMPTFASVAPQLNSTSAFTLFFFKYLRVTRMSSVAIFFPLRPLTDFIFEETGTARTQRTGLSVCFAYKRSVTL